MIMIAGLILFIKCGFSEKPVYHVVGGEKSVGESFSIYFAKKLWSHGREHLSSIFTISQHPYTFHYLIFGK